MAYCYPTPNVIYPDQPHKSYRLKRFRFWLRSVLHSVQVKKFSRFVNQHPEFSELLRAYPNYSYPVIHRFLDKRFNAEKRLEIVCDNLTFLPQKLAQYHLPPLWVKPINFGEVIPDFEIRLNINEYQAMEGFWALELRQKSSRQVVYLLTFGKIAQSLLIGVIQGANTENAKDLVKYLTKQCHGLRPAYLLIEVMKLLADTLGYSLLGIPHKYQNKSRFIQSKRYTVNYDTLFKESGGLRQEYWQLPLTLDKDLTDVPSNKRSMYRKRFEMLEKLADVIHQIFNLPTSS
ncbi:VirK/YbjX family protein [Actinobacillus genomosp. 1]|uniref:VirK/YbjX family protein n=1 Tax=Actinobacillus genomosp. 1 TaxID=254839 RepID=UPI002441D9DA|nr:VirK/YbjX family protein [Actinobacillus genomosp. 1]WGE91842.1 VirK/YbjX family protein [Actinobacillus genomosp. 1]